MGHPAHVHLFRNACKILKDKGWGVFIQAREKEVTRQLLSGYGLDYFPGSVKRSGISVCWELLEWFKIARRIIKQEKIDITVSIGSPAMAWAAKISGIPHLAFNDTEISVTQRLLYSPATSKIFTPACLKKSFGRKQVRYYGTHDLAYLRPEYFQPDKNILEQLGVEEGEKYIILRFVSWQASHDLIHRKTESDFKVQMAQKVSKFCKLFISDESSLPAQLEPYRLKNISSDKLHDAMAFAYAVIGDGSTTLTEAAVLGVPALYISSLANSLGVIDFYKKYGLLEAVQSPAEAMLALEDLLDETKQSKREDLRTAMLNETIDVTSYIVEQCEKNIIERVKRVK